MISLLKRIIICLLFIGLFSNVCCAQVPATDSAQSNIVSALTSRYKKYPQEKIFIHTNQPVYASGQTIWYKVYAAAYGKPSALSKIVYVQLSDANGRLIMQNKLPLKEAAAHGDISLPDSLRSGWYRIRGFTSWMMNFAEDEYYTQNIYIQNITDTVQASPAGLPKKKYYINFYPEGGDLIDEQVCHVAFKAVDDFGNPVTVTGEVLDSAKRPAATIVTTHSGMGILRLDVLGNAYTAVVSFPDGTKQRILLPKVKKEGISLHANAGAQGSVQLRIAYTGPPEKYKNLQLVAFQNTGKVAAYPLQLSRGINVFSIEKSLFDEGILRLTVFNGDNIPLAERLVFIDKEERQKIKLIADTVSLNPRQKQVFRLMNGSANAGYSVAVTDADAFASDTAGNIYSALLLNAELRGIIDNPAWYFNNGDNMQMLDLVMLTNGWRHFNWSTVLSYTADKLKYPVEQSQYVAGKIIDYRPPSVVKDEYIIKLLILNQDSSKYIGFVKPDYTGSFILSDYEYKGTSTLFMETSDKKDRVKKLKLNIFSTLADSLKTINGPALKIDESSPVPVKQYLMGKAYAEKQVRFQTNGIVLKTVNVKSKAINLTDQVIEDHVSPIYRSDREYTLDLVNNPSLDIGIFNYMMGRFPGLRITEQDGEYYFIYLGSNNLQSASPNLGLKKPYFYLNEAPVSYNAVLNIPIAEIALIRFIPPPIAFAPYNGGNQGAILVYTKQRSDDLRAKIVSHEKFDQYTFNGYTITREFSSPDYSKLKTNLSPDNRTTLYWNYNLCADINGHIKFSFYNTTYTKRYRVIIQGTDAEGGLTYLDEEYQAKP